MSTITLPGGALYVSDRKVVRSPYPPLVLVHGAGGTHLDWPPALRRLPGIRIVAVDLPGHGRSPGPARQSTLDYAKDICDLLDALHIKRAILAGHSMGGAIVQQVALCWPLRAAGLILLGTGSKLPVEPTLPRRALDDPAQTVEWIIEWAWSPSAPESLKTLSRQRLLETAPQTLSDDYRACQGFDVRDRLAEIGVPVLVVASAADRMVKLKFAQTLAERLPRATLVVVEGAGHMFPLEQPEEVAGTIRRWLAEQEWRV